MLNIVVKIEEPKKVTYNMKGGIAPDEYPGLLRKQKQAEANRRQNP